MFEGAKNAVFEDPEVAKYVLKVFLGINDQMDQCVASLDDSASPEELRALKKGVGYVMHEIFDKIVEPICKRHPSLRPQKMQD
jgi:hypothetical protein